MRRLDVRFRPAAPEDLEDIYRFVYRISLDPETAFGLVERIKDRCRRIGNTPYGGRPRDDLEKGLRTVPFERKAVIAYRVEKDCVRIQNIFYGGRDYEALYRNAIEQDD